MAAFPNLPAIPPGRRAHRLPWPCLFFIASLLLSSCGTTKAATPPAAASSKPAEAPTGWITFDSKQDGSWGIYIIPADGSREPAPLTVHPNGEYYSTWDPAGTRIAFNSWRDSPGSEGSNAIYILNSDGTGLTRLTDHTAKDHFPAWSPDGKWIAFTSDRNSNKDIYVIRPDGTGLKQLTSDPANDDAASWSPDGSQIAFESDRSGSLQIHLMRADGTGVTQLTQDTGAGDYPYLGVSPAAEDHLVLAEVMQGGPADLAGLQAGDRIQAADGVPLSGDDPIGTFVRKHKAGDEIELTVLRDGQQQVVHLTLGSASEMSSHPAWSPDGRQIAFASRRDGDWEIYLMAADGSGQHPITGNTAADFHPSWSPDGQYLAFSSNLEGNMDVYLMRADGSSLTQLTHDPSDEYPPRWAPAGLVVNTGPRFGVPACLRDADGDGQPETVTRQFAPGDETFFVTFPYANVSPALNWSLDLVMENADSQSYSEAWDENASGILTVEFPNRVGYSINTGGIRGSAIGPYPPGLLRVQLLIEGEVAQEIECPVVKP